MRLEEIDNMRRKAYAQAAEDAERKCKEKAFTQAHIEGLRHACAIMCSRCENGEYPRLLAHGHYEHISSVNGQPIMIVCPASQVHIYIEHYCKQEEPE